MTNKLILPTENEEKKPSKLNRYKNIPIVGKITSHIGSGEHAKDAFVWTTITWSFIIGSLITAVTFIKSWDDSSAACNLIDNVKAIWTIFVPLITLALGYSFGKGR